MASSNGYPFVSRKQVLARIASEPAFAVEAVRLIEERNGWMASHRPRAVRLLARLAAGAPTAEDLAEALALATPYSRTLARIARQKELAERPELMGVAAVFGVVRPSPAVETTLADAASAPVVDTTTTEAPAAPVKRRPGRPPGSKNRKPRSEPEQQPTKRRRGRS